MTKRYIVVSVLILVIVLLCGGIVGFNMFRTKMIGQFFANRQAPVQTISATPAQASSWQPSIDAIGTAKASQGIDVSVEVGGQVRTVTFKANDRVKAGQLLVQIDDAVERADMMAMQAALSRDEAAAKRQRDLRDRGVVAQAAVETTDANLNASRSNMARLRAVLDRKTINAPFAGVVGIPQINPGQYVQPGQVVATLQNLDLMRIDFTVPEQVATRLAIGQKVRVGANNDSLNAEGKLAGIEPRSDAQTRLVTARAEVDNKALGLRPGQFVHVRVDMATTDSVVTVIQTAVSTTLYGNYVYLIVDGDKTDDKGVKQQIVKQAFVKTGRREGNLIEITEGLKPGQLVVTSGQNKLSGGTPVKIDNSVDPAAIGASDAQTKRTTP